MYCTLNPNLNLTILSNLNLTIYLIFSNSRTCPFTKCDCETVFSCVCFLNPAQNHRFTSAFWVSALFFLNFSVSKLTFLMASVVLLRLIEHNLVFGFPGSKNACPFEIRNNSVGRRRRIVFSFFKLNSSPIKSYFQNTLHNFDP